jgi:hypothetical protein
MKAAISPKNEGRVITALPSSQFGLHLLIERFQDLLKIYVYDTRSSIPVGDLRIMISTAGPGPGSDPKS